MEDHRARLAELIAATSGGAVRALTSPLARSTDRTEPAGREWLKRWGPRPGVSPKLPTCACRTGTCRICN